MNRRHVLSLMGAAPFAPALLSSHSAHADGHLLNPNDPDDLYTIHRKLRYGFDDRLVYWYINAVRYGLMDSQFTPFWNMHVGFLAIASDAEDGFTTKGLTAIFYTDLDSGKLLETFTNPYTEERIPVNQPGLRKSSGRYGKAGPIRNRPERPGMSMVEFEGIGPAWVIGDDVWCRDDGGFRAEPTTDEGSLLHINDWTTYHGTISEVSDTGVTSANATQTFNDINTWPVWLNMGDSPGNYVSRGFGRKSWSIDGMPSDWRGIVQDQYPEVYADIRGYIESD